jgi:hypothetical protein
MIFTLLSLVSLNLSYRILANLRLGIIILAINQENGATLSSSLPTALFQMQKMKLSLHLKRSSLTLFLLLV